MPKISQQPDEVHRFARRPGVGPIGHPVSQTAFAVSPDASGGRASGPGGRSSDHDFRIDPITASKDLPHAPTRRRPAFDTTSTAPSSAGDIRAERRNFHNASQAMAPLICISRNAHNAAVQCASDERFGDVGVVQLRLLRRDAAQIRRDRQQCDDEHDLERDASQFVAAAEHGPAPAGRWRSRCRSSGCGSGAGGRG